ncbi:FG-GAP repeat protein, partial [Streptomyces humidus]|uniref:FG-GAP repeat protein n=1 Tax=Streptomyces humidus TaxID=52259 RepID=UPI003327713D
QNFQTASGDFNGDGRQDVAAFYDNGTSPEGKRPLPYARACACACAPPFVAAPCARPAQAAWTGLPSWRAIARCIALRARGVSRASW